MRVKTTKSRADEVAGASEIDVTTFEEDVIVLDANRPIRRKAIFEAGADRPAPAGLVARPIEFKAGCNVKGPVAIADDGGATFDVEQGVVPGVTDLARDQTKGVNFRLIAKAESRDRADIVAA